MPENGPKQVQCTNMDEDLRSLPPSPKFMAKNLKNQCMVYRVVQGVPSTASVGGPQGQS